MRGKSIDEFDLLSEYFSYESENIDDNINVLIKCFDCLCHINGYSNPALLFNKYFSHVHEEGKVLIENRYRIDPFEECITSLTEMRLPRFLFLYAIIVYLQNTDKVSESEFLRRIRIINNLIRNSNDEISNNESRDGGNRIPNEMAQINSIMLNGIIDLSIGGNFNVNQLNEEIEKEKWLSTNEDKSELLFKLEDHKLLHGQIEIVGLDNPEYFSRFESLFECEYDNIDCALMSIDFYGQQEFNRWRYQLGSGNSTYDSAWDNLFHRSKNIGFNETKTILSILLESQDSFTNDYLLSLKDSYIIKCERESVYDFRYYYMKYSEFRPRKFGKYCWNEFKQKPYKFYVLCTKLNFSENTYVPFLKVADNEHLSNKVNYGDVLVYDDFRITLDNKSYMVEYSDGRIDLLKTK
jgi:hypothetical protein